AAAAAPRGRAGPVGDRRGRPPARRGRRDRHRARVGRGRAGRVSLDLYDFPRLEPLAGAFEASRAGAGAADLISAAEAQAEAIRAEAAARGREEGLATAGEALGPARDALLAAVTGIEALRDELATAAELRSIELAVAIARKVVGAALAA